MKGNILQSLVFNPLRQIVLLLLNYRKLKAKLWSFSLELESPNWLVFTPTFFSLLCKLQHWDCCVEVSRAWCLHLASPLLSAMLSAHTLVVCLFLYLFCIYSRWKDVCIYKTDNLWESANGMGPHFRKESNMLMVSRGLLSREQVK